MSPSQDRTPPTSFRRLLLTAALALFTAAAMAQERVPDGTATASTCASAYDGEGCTTEPGPFSDLWSARERDRGPGRLRWLPMRPDETWTRADRSLLWSYLALSAVDAYQTTQVPEGYFEGNPLLAGWAGKRPSTFEVLLFKSATTYGLLHLAERVTHTPRSRRRLLAVMNAIQFSVDLRNERVTGGLIFD